MNKDIVHQSGLILLLGKRSIFMRFPTSLFPLTRCEKLKDWCFLYGVNISSPDKEICGLINLGNHYILVNKTQCQNL